MGNKPRAGRVAALIEGLLPLARAFAAEADRDSGGLGIDLFSLAEPTPAKDAFVDALGKLRADDLHRIETVMYAGREQRDDEDAAAYLDLHHTLRRDDAEITTHIIASKVPVAEYLRRGLDLAARCNVNLDALSAVRFPR